MTSVVYFFRQFVRYNSLCYFCYSTLHYVLFYWHPIDTVRACYVSEDWHGGPVYNAHCKDQRGGVCRSTRGLQVCFRYLQPTHVDVFTSCFTLSCTDFSHIQSPSLPPSHMLNWTGSASPGLLDLLWFPFFIIGSNTFLCPSCPSVGRLVGWSVGLSCRSFP